MPNLGTKSWSIKKRKETWEKPFLQSKLLPMEKEPCKT